MHRFLRIFFRYSNRRNTFNFISHKIISSRSGNNFLQHSFQLLRCVWHFPEKKVYIHCHTTVKIGNGIDEQTALKYKIFSIFGFFQSAQKFLLAKKLQAKLIGSSAFVRFVFNLASTDAATSGIEQHLHQFSHFL